jgi:hypothetical protein
MDEEGAMKESAIRFMRTRDHEMRRPFVGISNGSPVIENSFQVPFSSSKTYLRHAFP